MLGKLDFILICYIHVSLCYLISSCQFPISGLRETSLHLPNVKYVMKYAAVKDGFKDSDVYGVM